MTAHDGGPVGGNGATKSWAGKDLKLTSTIAQAGANDADRAPVPMPKADAGRVTSELRQALGSLLWSVRTIRRHQYGALS